jgi:ABC-2 type transport system ATP-binding protein
VQSGVTLMLTTQYLEEADALADEIAVIDHGRVIAKGTADQLKSEVGGERIEVVVHRPEDVGRARELLVRFALGSEVDVDEHARRLTVPSSGGSSVLVQVIRELDAEQVAIDDIGLRRPTLDDVFLTLTGHVAEAAEDAQEPEPAGRPA